MSGVRVDDCVIGSNNRTVSGYEVVCQVSTEIGVVDCAVVSLSAPLTFVWDGRPLLLVAGITSSRFLEDLVESFMCETRDLDVSVTFGLVVLGLLGALDRLHFEVRSVEVLDCAVGFHRLSHVREISFLFARGLDAKWILRVVARRMCRAPRAL